MNRKLGTLGIASFLLFASACAKKQTVKAPVTVAREAAPAPPAPDLKNKEGDDGAVARQDRSAGDDNAIYFDFDSSLLRDEARSVLQSWAAQLRTSPAKQVRVEGNCDQTGTTEYNIALGETRAHAAKKYLQALGVPSQRIKTISYGKLHPKYPGTDEASLAKNRRDDIVVVH